MTAWKLAIVVVCVCVFLFVLHAKLVLYDPPSPGATAIAASKLWASNQKLEVRISQEIALVLWISSLFFLGLSFTDPEELPVEPAPAFRYIDSLGLHRFLRPPPFFS